MSRAARKRATIIQTVCKVVEVGEQVSSREIMDRINAAEFIVKATPNSVHSLAMILRGDSRYVKIVIGSEKKKHYQWRRTE
tara:strand:+ start:39 stop:281 length:243 start_codon:yes stop_codon:yes gene_type:complete